MFTQFKPGDIVSHPECGRGIVHDAGWVVFADDWDSTILSNVTADLRRLVVIDPEDREQVERLRVALDANYRSEGDFGIAAALREFANPKPKPDEPTGIGAVVEDSSGHKWVRARHHDTDDTWWRCSRWGGWAAWADIDAVRVLNEGVQP